MDEKSILLMSEELRTAMGAGVKKVEIEAPERAGPVVVLGRLIRYAALKSGRSRLTFDTHAQLNGIHDARTPFDIHLVDKSVELDMTVQAVKSVSIARGSQTRYTLIVDAQSHK